METKQYLTFQLPGGEYGLALLRVREIVQYEPPTPVPHAPRVVRGLINLRGSVVPVVDLTVKLGLEPSPITRRTCIVVVELADRQGAVMGIAADAVRRVVDLGGGDIEPVPDFGLPVKPEFLAGLGKVGKSFVLLLDADRLLTADELTCASEVPIAPPEPPAA